MTCTTGRRTVEDITGWGDRGGGERGGKRWDGRVAALLAAPHNEPAIVTVDATVLYECGECGQRWRGLS